VRVDRRSEVQESNVLSRLVLVRKLSYGAARLGLCLVRIFVDQHFGAQVQLRLGAEIVLA